MPTLQVRKEDHHENLCEELMRERALVLTRAGIAVEEAVEQLMQTEREIETKELLLESFIKLGNMPEILEKRRLLVEEVNYKIDNFNDLCRHAQLKYYYLIVTREAMGLRRHQMIQEIYCIPKPKKKVRVI